VNKMDLVGYSEPVFARIAAEFTDFVRGLGHQRITAVPVSALHGDNIAAAAGSMPWYTGPTLLEHLETVQVEDDAGTRPFRFPVQIVLRPGAGEHRDYRGYAGQVTSGMVRVGDEVVVQPSGLTTRVTAIDGLHGPLVEARSPLSITIRVADDLDISRGDLLADSTSPGRVTRELGGIVCWLGDRPLDPGNRILLRVATRTVPALVSRVGPRLDVATLTWEPVDRLRLNDIGRIDVRTAEPVAVDDFRDDRHTGGFLLVDQADGSSLAAGMTGDPPVAVPHLSHRPNRATTPAS